MNRLLISLVSAISLAATNPIKVSSKLLSQFDKGASTLNLKNGFNQESKSLDLDNLSEIVLDGSISRLSVSSEAIENSLSNFNHHELIADKNKTSKKSSKSKSKTSKKSSKSKSKTSKKSSKSKSKTYTKSIKSKSSNSIKKTKLKSKPSIKKTHLKSK